MRCVGCSAEELDLELEKLYPEAECSLFYKGDPFRLLIMAILSAQCTDARVNEVSARLFREYPNASAMADADFEAIAAIVRPCGLYKSKAKHIIESAKIISRDHGGELPREMEQLLALPGVGRKIANLVRGDIFSLGGIVADTHCIRITNRFGFTEKADPIVTERTMSALILLERQAAFCHRLVLFGREYCTARNPRCDECPIGDFVAKRDTK